jgi:hypothetical protein
MQKSPGKKYFKFWEIQNKQISDKKTYYFNTIVLPFAVTNLFFLYFPKYNVFFNGNFLQTHILYIFIYIFNTIIFRDTEVYLRPYVKDTFW